MSNVLRYHVGFSPMESSTALAKKAEHAYQEMIDAKLLNTLERMAQPDYQAISMPDDFHDIVLKRVLARLEQRNVSS